MGVRICTRRRSVVSACVCERVSVFLSCWYMCITSVSTYLLSSVCFKWHKCIVKQHTCLWGADKQPNTNTGFFSGYQGRSIVVILNTTQGTWHWKAHYMRKTRDNCVFHCECLSLAISSLPLSLKWGTGCRSGYISVHLISYQCINSSCLVQYSPPCCPFSLPALTLR